MEIAVVRDVEPDGRARAVAVQVVVDAALFGHDERHLDVEEVQLAAESVFDVPLDGRDRELGLFRIERRSEDLRKISVDRREARLARGFARLGVRKGERVVVMMPNGIDMALVWFALCKLGAVMVPMNQAYRGGILLHQVNNCEPACAVVHAEFVAVFHEVRDRLAPLRQLVLCDADNACSDQARQIAEVEWLETFFEESDSALPPVVEIWDPMAIMYTSGTTGPSKGVLYGHGQAYAAAAPMAIPMASDDILYSFSPMHHVALPVLFLEGARLPVDPIAAGGGG